MDFEDFWLLRAGWHDKLIYEQQIARRMAYIVHCSMSPKPLALSRLWPLPGDKKGVKVGERQLALLKKFREIDAMKKVKEKLNAGSKSKNRS